jgi:hypothetical protein
VAQRNPALEGQERSSTCSMRSALDATVSAIFMGKAVGAVEAALHLISTEGPMPLSMAISAEGSFGKAAIHAEDFVVILTRIQSVTYHKTILVGPWHTWRPRRRSRRNTADLSSLGW